ncbi:MAG: agmatine deiminase family protein [Spirochaetota bacterium]
MRKKILLNLFVLALATLLSACNAVGTGLYGRETGEDEETGNILGFVLASSVTQDTNVVSDSRMTLVLAAPSVNDTTYANNLQEIVDFQVSYASSIIGKDNVVVIVDSATLSYYQNRLPDDVILVDDIFDIWTRDFTTINPANPVQFTYTSASTPTQAESQSIQTSFTTFADKYSLTRGTSSYIIDGGNIVDDYNGNYITTTRFNTDNSLTSSTSKTELKSVLGATNVAIIEPDDDVLAHSDGMVMWLENNVLLVNDYSTINSTLRTSVLAELTSSFPSATIVEVPVQYADNAAVSQVTNINSACGVNLNSVVTNNYVYVPTFNMSHDSSAVAKIRENTSRTVVEIDAQNVCALGGSVRCLTWQVTGDNASKLIIAARQN